MQKRILLLLAMVWTAGIFHLPAQSLEVLSSDYLPTVDSVWVFQPRATGVDQKFPLVFLLHGWSGNYTTWNQIVDCQHLADSFRMILVCPDGLYDSWYMNHPSRVEIRYEDFFACDLIDAIRVSYPVDTQAVFITGLSMGGFGALHLAAKNKGIFRAAGAMSGVFDFSREVLRNRGLADADSTAIIWGEIGLLPEMRKQCLPDIPVYLDCGDRDIYLEDSKLLFKNAQKCGLKYTFEIYPGKHERPFWKESIYRHLSFFKKTLTVH